MTTHTLARQPPTLDTIIRSRIRDLLRLRGVNMVQAADQVGWALSTLRRRLHLDPDDRANYRRLHLGDIDELVAVTGDHPSVLLHAVLLPGDEALLRWIGERTPVDPLPSRALLKEVGDGDLLERLRLQGLVAICGEPDHPEGHYLRLTPDGQRALGT